MILKAENTGGEVYLHLLKSANQRPNRATDIGLLLDVVNSHRIDDLLEDEKLVVSPELKLLTALAVRDFEPDQRYVFSGLHLLLNEFWGKLGINDVISHNIFQYSSQNLSDTVCFFLSLVHTAIFYGHDFPQINDSEVEMYHDAMELLGQPVDRKLLSYHNNFGPKDLSSVNSPTQICRLKDLIDDALWLRNRPENCFLELLIFSVDEQAAQYPSHRQSGAPYRWLDFDRICFAAVFEDDGTPVSTEIIHSCVWDIEALIPAVDRIKERFNIDRVCVVFSRPENSQQIIKKIQKQAWHYVVHKKPLNDELRDFFRTYEPSLGIKEIQNFLAANPSASQDSPKSPDILPPQGQEYDYREILDDEDKYDCLFNDNQEPAEDDYFDWFDDAPQSYKGDVWGKNAENPVNPVNPVNQDNQDNQDNQVNQVKQVLRVHRPEETIDIETSLDMEFADILRRYRRLYLFKIMLAPPPICLKPAVLTLDDNKLYSHLWSVQTAYLLRKTIMETMDFNSNRKGHIYTYYQILDAFSNVRYFETQIGGVNFLLSPRFSEDTKKLINLLRIEIPVIIEDTRK
jgi:hypothetical protein